MIFAITMSRVTKKRKIIAIAKPNKAYLPTLSRRTYDYNISLSTFLRKIEIKDYFYVMD